MRTLPLQDQRHLDAAEGWLGLDDWTEANQELEQIRPSVRGHPYVLLVRYEVLAKARRWDEAVAVAQTLLFLFPERPESWICWAYSTRRKSEGGLVAAKEILVQAEARFPAEYLISYNLACYECLLGNLKASRMWLKKAFVLAGSMDIRAMAMEDEELQSLWRKMGEI
jgi:hypothetical protein